MYNLSCICQMHYIIVFMTRSDIISKKTTKIVQQKLETAAYPNVSSLIYSRIYFNVE